MIDLAARAVCESRCSKREFVAPEDNGLLDKLRTKYYDDYKEAVLIAGKHDRGAAKKEVKDRIIAEMIPDPEADNAFSVE